MGWQDLIGGVLNQFTGSAAAPGQDPHAQYDQLSSIVPSSVIGSVIGPALGSMATQEVTQHLLGSANAMNPEQRGTLFSTLLSGFTSQGTDASSLLGSLGISPGVAADPQSASAQDVAALAAHAHENAPDVFHKAMEFYSEHPTLVKTLGAVAVGLIVKHFLAKHG
jgi:hypothetical protein